MGVPAVVALVLSVVAAGAAAPTLSERVYRQLVAASAAAESGNAAQAEQALMALSGDTALSPYERAVVWQTLGQLLARQARHADAIAAYERGLDSDAAATALQTQALHTLVSLYATQERWVEARTAIDRWLASRRAPPPPDAFGLIAAAYAEARRYGDALPWLERAIEAAPEPLREHHLLRVVMRYETGDYAGAAAAAAELVRHWPGPAEHWSALQAAHRAAGDEAAALAAMRLADRRGALTDPRARLDLVRLELHLDLPYDAGERLERDLRAGRVPDTADTRALLVDAWAAAREVDKAVAALARPGARAAQHLRAAELLRDDGRHGDAQRSARAALADPAATEAERAEAWLLIGAATWEQGQVTEARRAFEAAARHGGRSAARAREWLAYLDGARPARR